VASRSSISLTSNRYEDSVAPELQLETVAYGGRGHGEREEVLLDLRLAAELPEAVQCCNRRIGLCSLHRVFAGPFDQGEGYRRGGKVMPGNLRSSPFFEADRQKANTPNKVADLFPVWYYIGWPSGQLFSY
jgi:hypothetical protein